MPSPVSQLHLPSACLCFFFFFGFVVSWSPDYGNSTAGFTQVPLNASHLELHKPYDLPPCTRYLFSGDTHRFWVLKDDQPAWVHPLNGFHPRTEIRIRGHEYTSGVWQFEGSLYVPRQTTGVCVFQVFGPWNGHPTILMLKVFRCVLYDFDMKLARHICNRWLRLNVIHDADSAIIYIYIDGALVKTVRNRKKAQHWFQFGVYSQKDYSYYMEARWRSVKVLKLES